MKHQLIDDILAALVGLGIVAMTLAAISAWGPL